MSTSDPEETEREALSEYLMKVYDHGIQPNAPSPETEQESDRG